MKRVIYSFATIALFLFGAFFWMELRRLPDLSPEIEQRLEADVALAPTQEWDRVIKIEPYGNLNDRDGISFSAVRRQYGEFFNYDGAILLIFVKNNHPVAIAEVSRKWDDKFLARPNK